MNDLNPVQRMVKLIALNVTIAGAAVLGLLLLILLWGEIKPELFVKLAASVVIVWMVTGIVCYSVYKKYEVKADRDDLY